VVALHALISPLFRLDAAVMAYAKRMRLHAAHQDTAKLTVVYAALQASTLIMLERVPCAHLVLILLLSTKRPHAVPALPIHSMLVETHLAEHALPIPTAAQDLANACDALLAK